MYGNDWGVTLQERVWVAGGYRFCSLFKPDGHMYIYL